MCPVRTRSVNILKQVSEFSTATIATAVGMLKLRDPSVGYTWPGVRALMPE